MKRFKFFNMNPYHKDTQDCTIRAISLFLNKTWDEVYWGVCDEGYRMKQMPSTNTTWISYLKRNGCIRYTIPDTCPDCYTVERFCYEHPHGVFLLKVDGHVVAVMDGCYYDTWDSGNEVVSYYWVKGE